MGKCVPNKTYYYCRNREGGEQTTSYCMRCAMCYVLLYSVNWQFGLTAFSKGHGKLIVFSNEKKTEFDYNCE